jgi:hypothetical protein
MSVNFPCDSILKVKVEDEVLVLKDPVIFNSIYCLDNTIFT